MQTIVVPFSEVVSYLNDTLDQWPRGYRYAESSSERNEILVKAACAFTKAYIQDCMRHIRRKPDPLAMCIEELGYPVRAMSAEEFDSLCIAADEHYLAMVLILDPMMDHIQRVVGTRLIEFRHIRFTEDLIVDVKDDVLLERYKALASQARRLNPPKIVRELDDLEQYEEYIDHCLHEVFGSIANQTIRDEVKRIYLEKLSRQ